MKRVAIYARVSATDQTCDNQLRDLRDYCRARGWSDVREFIDTGISGTSLPATACRNQALVASLQRFGRRVRAQAVSSATAAR